MAGMEEIRPAELSAIAARTATFTTASLDRENFGRAREWVILQQVGTVTGTTPSLTTTIEHSDDGSTGWATVSWGTGGASTATATFSATTATGLKELRVPAFGQVKRFIRAVNTITGTTPSFTMGLIAIATDARDRPI